MLFALYTALLHRLCNAAGKARMFLCGKAASLTRSTHLMPRCAAGEYLFSMLKAGSISNETVFPTPTCRHVLSCCYTMHTCHPCWRLHHTATRTPRHAAHMPHTCAAAGEGRAIVLHARHLGRGCSAWPQLLAASCVGVVAPAQGPPEPHAPWLRGLFVMHKLGTLHPAAGQVLALRTAATTLHCPQHPPSSHGPCQGTPGSGSRTCGKKQRPWCRPPWQLLLGAGLLLPQTHCGCMGGAGRKGSEKRAQTALVGLGGPVQLLVGKMKASAGAMQLCRANLLAHELTTGNVRSLILQRTNARVSMSAAASRSGKRGHVLHCTRGRKGHGCMLSTGSVPAVRAPPAWSCAGAAPRLQAQTVCHDAFYGCCTGRGCHAYPAPQA